MKQLFILILSLLMSSGLLAQITVQGDVIVDPSPDEIVAGLPVMLNADGNLLAETVVLPTGGYVFSLDSLAITEVNDWSVSTLDVCNGSEVEVFFEVSPNETEYNVDLTICEGIFPPPPPDTCTAFFNVEQTGPLSFHFSTLESAFLVVDSIFWEFGDGNGSYELGPDHTYANGGIYPVTLTVYTENCTATNTELIFAIDSTDCICDEVYDPVCVFDQNGDILTFDNLCLANCAGYGFGPVFDCEQEDCICPTFYAPVCVINSIGDTLTYSNHCFAECDGFGPDTWFECEIDEEPDNCGCDLLPEDPVCIDILGAPIPFRNPCEAECNGIDLDSFPTIACDSINPPNECECFEIYDPVCVTDSNGITITFTNACYAECSGYGEEQFVDCDQFNCEDFPFPVCAVDSVAGEVVSFENVCDALDAGYPEHELFPCDGGVDSTDCTAAFYTYEADGSGLTIAFVSLAYDPAGNNIYSWDFGDGNVSGEANPIHTYAAEGTYTVTLIVGNATCTVMSSELVFVNSSTDCNCFEIYEPVCVLDSIGGTIVFSNACFAACAGYDEDDFVDCQPNDCGLFPFQVCATDSITGQDIAFENVCDALDAGYSSEELFPCGGINDSICYASFSYYHESEDGFTIAFVDRSETFDEVSYFWDFGDGVTSTEEDPIHTYAEEGNYVVTLTISGADCESNYSLDVYIGDNTPSDIDCQAFFFFEQPDSTNLLTYQFINFSQGSADEVLWDFGDGTTSTETNPSHTYAVEGSYTVRLTISGSDCQSTFGVAINAGENIWYGDLECRAWFLPVIVSDSNYVYFLNLSSYDATEYFWDFGDGTLSNDFQPGHLYTEAGEYTVTLTTVSESGCENTYTVIINFNSGNFTSDPSFRLLNSIDEEGNITPPEVKVFPNPTNGLVNVSWENGTSGRYDWTLLNIAGQTVQRGQGRNVGLNGSFQLEMGREVPGIYLLRLHTPEGIQVFRISKH